MKTHNIFMTDDSLINCTAASFLWGGGRNPSYEITLSYPLCFLVFKLIFPWLEMVELSSLRVHFWLELSELFLQLLLLTFRFVHIFHSCNLKKSNLILGKWRCLTAWNHIVNVASVNDLFHFECLCVSLKILETIIMDEINQTSKHPLQLLFGLVFTLLNCMRYG